MSAEHLRLLGVRAESAGFAVRDGTSRLELFVDRPVPEPVLQALTGLMAIHGRDHGAPRRLGIDVATVATELLAGQGLLAGLIARRRGLNVTAVDLPGPAGALQFLTHHLAIATGGGTFPYAPAGVPGPPFATADGVLVELEMLSGDDWVAFWRRLGLDRADEVGAGWLPFVYRYLAGRCELPPALAGAVRRHSFAQVRAAAEACGAVAVAVREPATAAPPWTITPHPGGPVADGRRRAPIAAPLQGLRVVEATSRLQGPLAGLLLRHLGADVVKVEPPGGDFGRYSPPLAGDVGAAYLAYNRGKRVVEIDYKRPAGRDDLRELAAGADVFVHNWRPGRAGALGVDSADLARLNPAAVYAYASGWGGAPDAPGPIAGDFTVQAYAGTGALLHPPGDPPVPSRLTLVDVTGGLLVAEAILAALHERERTGRGGRVDTSLVGAATVLAGAPHRRWGPLHEPIPTPAGHLVVAPDDTPVRELAGFCGLPPDADPATIAGRLGERPAAHRVAELQAAGIVAAVARTDLAELPADPHLTGLLEHADGACWVPGTPWRFHAR
ncbi:CoA transferase [Nucisporomicrobium flavum]|uniref:CoA transferase n=1 Tax=Nucisporomicrobium flavum TaxID=2785915 RepID=UPI003C2DDA58